MSNNIKRIIVTLMLTSIVITLSAQVKRLVVTGVEGKAEYVAKGHKHPLRKGTILTDESLVYIPFNGMVTIIDERNNKEYTVKSIGWASVGDKLQDARNTALTRTKNYVNSVLAQLRGKTSPKAQYVSDPATITREYYADSALTVTERAKKEETNPFRAEFEAFKKQARREYDDFRKQALKEYADFVRQAWAEFRAEPAKEMPKEEEIEPILVPGADAQTESWFSRLFGRRKSKKKKQQAAETVQPTRQESQPLKYKEVVKAAPVDVQPQPLSEVKEVPEDANSYVSFKLFGTDCNVRMGDNCMFTLPGASAEDVANAIALFEKPQFDNLLYDCLKMRREHKLSDWAYLQMLMVLTNLFYGTNTNESVLTLAFLYGQSGYKMRIATNGTELQMLVACKNIIYNKKFYHTDGENYYMLDGRNNDILQICPATFPKESALSLQISAEQDLTAAPTPERTITSKMDESFSFTVKSNKNYMDFYDTYPSSCYDDNFMTRWAIYANTPLEKGLRSQLYPAMREKLRGLSKRDAVQQLLYWVQTGFEYGYDDEIWGGDRAFFGEESIFYPYCDCEDRSILLSRLVRDLLGLKTILIYYPGHLAMGVGFEQDEEGDYIMLDGQKFIVCDPTYIPSKVGQTMPHMNNEEATVILLN